MRLMLRLAAVCLCLIGFSVSADDIWSALTPMGTARVIEVIDGDTVIIDPAIRDRRQVRLVGLQAPKLPLGRKGFRSWPLAHESRDALAVLVAGAVVELFSDGAAVDRHGRLLAHLRLGDGRWVQGEVIRGGWARVYSFPDNRALVAEMLAHERRARKNRAGIWNHPNYAPRTPDNAAQHVGRFELVEGRVVDASVHKGTGYLNFGDNWRTDFTAVIRKSALRLFRKAGIDVGSYTGAHIRVRGWLGSYNGPMVELTHPEQIERLQPGG